MKTSAGYRLIAAFSRLALLAVMALVFPPSSEAMADCANPTGPGTIATSSCDCDYWQSLESRAWLEAEREVVQYQNLIFKPDSVLEYTCFGNFLGHAAKHVGPIFSDKYGRGGSLQGALQRVVYNSMVVYLSGNFGHKFLGERSSLGGGGVPGFGANDYVCDAMQQVWEEAKCYNFMTEANDGWFSLEEYRDGPDKRVFPVPCQKDTRWAQFLTFALESPIWYQKVSGEYTGVHTQVGQQLMPGACTVAVPTGLTVDSLGRGGYPDAFCPNPGCTYNGAACH